MELFPGLIFAPPNIYQRLKVAPRLRLTTPRCGTCMVEVRDDADGYVCPVCGTAWPHGAGDDEQGELYESWSGEPAGGVAL